MWGSLPGTGWEYVSGMFRVCIGGMYRGVAKFLSGNSWLKNVSPSLFSGSLPVRCWFAACLLLACCRLAAGLLLYCCWFAAGLLLVCCSIAAGLLLVCCWFAAVLLLVCCWLAALLLLVAAVLLLVCCWLAAGLLLDGTRLDLHSTKTRLD